jgi:hypothetical protein
MAAPTLIATLQIPGSSGARIALSASAESIAAPDE